MGFLSHNWSESGNGKARSDVSSFAHGTYHNGRISRAVNVAICVLKHRESELLWWCCCEHSKGQATVVVGTKGCGGVVLVSYLIITVEETHVLLRAKRLELT